MPKGEPAEGCRTFRCGAADETAPRAQRRRAAAARGQAARVIAEILAKAAAIIIGNSRITIMFWRAIGDVRPALAEFDNPGLPRMPGTEIGIRSGPGEITP
jgi:hypothetical protein